MASQIYYPPFLPAFSSNGAPVQGALLNFYVTGTSTRTPVYADDALLIMLPNPVPADAAGRFPNIYLDETITYRVVQTGPDGFQLGADIDPYYPGQAVSIVPDLPTFTDPSGASNVGFVQSGAAAVPENLETAVRRFKWAEQRGLVGLTMPAFDALTPAQKTERASANSIAILAAIAALRTNPVDLSTDGLNGGPFTAYSSGELLIGEGIFPIAPDVLRLTQDLGLVIKGRGSRKTNNAVLGRTVLLVTGNGQFGIQTYGNGARGLVMEDIDLCYEGNAFTGDLLDNFGSPGMVLNRCHLGTNGITGGTSFQTARSLIRSTYGEFIHCVDTTLDGGALGVWFDDMRSPAVGPPIEFGGSGMLFTSCVFYDFSNAMVRATGARNLKKLSFRDCTFNPIRVDCVRGLDLTNVDALSVSGCLFTPSTDHIATAGWLRLTNCTGVVEANEFLGNCAIGTVDGNLRISNNFIDATDGFELKGGVITGEGNEFSRCTSGWKMVATRGLCFRLGPDQFKGTDVGYSYDVPADSALLDGHITYTAAQDASTSKFRNTSARVTIRANDEKAYGISAASYTPGIEDTGRTVRAEGTAAQTFTLPALMGSIGLKYRFVRNGAFDLTIAAPAPGKLFVGGGPGKAQMTAPAGDVGAIVEVQNFDGSGWNVTTRTGGWIFE